MRRKPVFQGRRLLLATAALLAMASPMLASGGCGGGFDSISKIDALRVLAVVPYVLDDAHPTPETAVTGSYARPGDEVTLHMSYYDGYVDPANPNAPSRNVQILWLAGCYNPPGDAYYNCYSQLAETLSSIDPENPIASDLIGFGPTFKTTLPGSLVSQRPRPPAGPYYGIAYYFFVVCAGQIKPIPPSGGGQAGSFPLGCFDEGGQRLGAESFIPGYTQVYAFDDNRLNENPRVKGMSMLESKGFEITHHDLLAAPDQAVKVTSCGVSDADRNAPPSCSKPDPIAECATYKIDIEVGDEVAELDPDSTDGDGNPLKEVVWVDYFAEKGDFEVEVKLVNDATTGLVKNHSTRYIPPSESGLVTIWAVVHDARGGSTILERYLRVE